MMHMTISIVSWGVSKSQGPSKKHFIAPLIYSMVIRDNVTGKNPKTRAESASLFPQVHIDRNSRTICYQDHVESSAVA